MVVAKLENVFDVSFFVGREKCKEKYSATH